MSASKGNPSFPPHVTKRRLPPIPKQQTACSLGTGGDARVASRPATQNWDNKNQDSGSKKHNIDSNRAIPSKLKNRPVNPAPERPVDIEGDHRKIIKYCDDHSTTDEEFDEWIANIDPHLKHSLSKRAAQSHGGTLLHHLVDGPRQFIANRFEKRFKLLKWLLENVPDLYKEVDFDKQTVLELLMHKSHLSGPKSTSKNSGINPFAEYFVKKLPELTAQQLSKSNHTIFGLLPLICGPDIRGMGSLYFLLPYLTDAQLNEKDEDGNTLLHFMSRYKYSCDEEPESQESLRNAIEATIRKYPDSFCEHNKSEESPYLHRVNTAKDYFKDNGDTWHPDVITHLLKDHCMHQPPEHAMKLLYGSRIGTEHQISLNLEELSHGRGTITKAMLIKCLKGFQFESILQYVLIPCLTFAPEKGSTGPNMAVKVQKSDGTGREECQDILLRCLHEKKGVRKIIELVVYDDQTPPHKDSVIASLGIFDIENFNWKKLDLCTETIFQAAPNANKIVLYSSGNNAVLRSWSAMDGLARFPKLKEVEVKIDQCTESAASVKEMIARFRERMEKNCPQVSLKVELVKTTVKKAATMRGNIPNDTKTISANINAWMNTMENFATFIRNIPDLDLPSERRPIKVAVIDDGIDSVYNMDKFATTLKKGKSFCAGPKHLPFYFSSTGHGTLMADLVQRICPRVHLYVARLDGLQTGGTVGPTAESAAKAIKWAIDEEVDIISMSWTVTGNYGNLRHNIELADHKKILMFGAASDQGYNAPSKVYPAELDQVFCIGAAEPTGKADSAAKPQADYCFPGGELSDIKARGGDGTPQHAWGSSFATALASGLTALILDCTEIVGHGKSYRDTLRTRDSVNAIFKNMVPERGSKYIPVATFFHREMANSFWDEEGKEKLKKQVEDIIRPAVDI